MRRSAALTGLALLAALALPARAGRKLDEATAKADEQLRKGRPDDALKTLRKAVQQAPGDPVAHRALARLHERLGDLEGAGASFAKAVEAAATAPARSAALADLAVFELRTAPTARARGHAEEAVRLDASVEALAALARVQARAGDPAAFESAERARRAAPQAAAGHAALGEALLALARPEQAAAAFRRALELDAGSVSAAAGLAVALADLGRAADAVPAARAAAALDEKRAAGFAALALALLAADPRDAKAEAIAQAQQAAFLEPANAGVKLVVARVFEARGQPDQAAQAYREAASLDPSWSAARLALARLAYRRHDVEGALAEIAGLPPELKGRVEVALLHARVLLLKEDPAAAAAVLEAAGPAVARSAEAQATLGAAYYGAREVDQAAAAYKAAAELEPGNDTYLTNYALFLGYAGRHREAAGLLAKITSQPGYADPAGFINLGWLYRNMKPARVDDAVAAYRRALQLDPHSGQAALGVALAYYRGKYWDEALRAFRHAAQVDGRLEGDALNGVAWCYFFKRDMPRARASAEQARAAGNPDAAAVLAAVKRFEQAVKQGETRVRAVLNHELRFRDRSELRALVDQLGAGTPAQQRQAAVQLCKRRAEGVPYLAYALVRRGDLEARERIVACLATMGAVARPALSTLDRLVAEGPPTPDPDAPPADVEQEVREAALVGAMQSAATRIRAAR